MRTSLVRCAFSVRGCLSKAGVGQVLGGWVMCDNIGELIPWVEVLKTRGRRRACSAEQFRSVRLRPVATPGDAQVGIVGFVC